MAACRHIDTHPKRPEDGHRGPNRLHPPSQSVVSAQKSLKRGREDPNGEAVAAGSPYRYPLWLARALNSAFYDVKWDYESDRAIARIADFYIKIAVFIINLCCCAPFCKYT